MIIEFREKYAMFSNFFPCEINYNGNAFRSVEHAYQSQKNDDKEWLQYCIDEQSAGKVKKRSMSITVREDWQEINMTIMETLLRQKFSKQPFKNLLITTGNQNIQEGNHWGDTFWGIDLKNSPNQGENHLGRMLMEIRKDLQHIDSLENL